MGNVSDAQREERQLQAGTSKIRAEASQAVPEKQVRQEPRPALFSWHCCLLPLWKLCQRELNGSVSGLLGIGSCLLSGGNLNHGARNHWPRAAWVAGCET